MNAVRLFERQVSGKI